MVLTSHERLAIFGMIIVNFKIVFGNNGSDGLNTMANFFTGKAVALFVVIAGIGIALMTNSAYTSSDPFKLKIARKRIIKRALFLFVVGLSYMWIWPADILHFYGVYMLITLFFINKSQKVILLVAGAIICTYPILILFFDYETGWNFETFDYSGFWTLDGFCRNLFFNGFHPVIPWTSFMLFGLWFGRQDLNSTLFLKRSFWVSLIVFIGIQLLSSGSIYMLSQGDQSVRESLIPLLGTEPMPPLPLYMINGISISVVLISMCILITKGKKNNLAQRLLINTGKLALTFYVAHVVLGMGLAEVLSPIELGKYSIAFSLSYALLFSVLCVIFAHFWLRHRKIGPLEWMMRKFTD